MREAVKWTNLSRREVARQLKALGTPVCKEVVSQLLREAGSGTELFGCDALAGCQIAHVPFAVKKGSIGFFGIAVCRDWAAGTFLHA